MNVIAKIAFFPFLLPIWVMRTVFWVASIPLRVILKVLGFDKVELPPSEGVGSQIGRDAGDRS